MFVVNMDNMRMPEISRARALAYLAAVIAALVVGGRFLVGSDGGDAATAHPTTTLAAHELEPAGAGTSGPDQPTIVVHVAGAVRHPGIYMVPDGSRVDDAIAAAGGAKRGAKLHLLNLASLLSDGQQVLVPGRASAGDSVTPAPSSAGVPPPPVNLNTASLEDLDVLPGVGPVTAQRILDYRSEHGPFASVDELDAVPGIGPARLEQLRELVTV